MWGFIDCTRYYRSFGVPQVILHDASMVVETHEKVSLLVRPGQGKSTIIRLLAGVDRPDSGIVLRDPGGWPLGYAGAFRSEMSGEENVHNIANLVGLDAAELAAFCAEFSDLGEAFFHPLGLYTGRMRGQLAFAVSLGIPATTYLADERLSAGDEAFRSKCEAAIAERTQTAGLILVGSNPRYSKNVCDRHGVVRHGKIVMCDTAEEAEELFGQTTDQPGAKESDDEDVVSFDLA